MRLPIGLLVVAVHAPAPSVVEVRSLDATVRGEIAGLENSTLVLRTEDGPARIDCAEVLSVTVVGSTRAASTGGSLVELGNGDRLVGAVDSGKGDSLRFRFGAREPVELPVSRIRRWVNLGKAGGRDADAFAPPPDGDRLYLPSEGGLDHLDGTLSSFDGDALVFESVLGRSRRKFDDTVAIVLAPEGEIPAAAGLVGSLDFVDGSRVTGRLASFAEGAFEVVSPIGPKFSVPLASLVSIGFRNGRFVYLSDLEPEETVETPYFGGADALRFPPKRDRSVGGGPLRCGGREYARGLGLHSRTVVRYRLDGAYRRFRALAGIDDEVRSFAVSGTAVLRVIVDGKVAFEEPALRAGAEPVRVGDVDLSGAAELRIEVDFGEGMHVGDRVDLLEPVLVRA